MVALSLARICRWQMTSLMSHDSWPFFCRCIWAKGRNEYDNAICNALQLFAMPSGARSQITHQTLALVWWPFFGMATKWFSEVLLMVPLVAEGFVPCWSSKAPCQQFGCQGLHSSCRRFTTGCTVPRSHKATFLHACFRVTTFWTNMFESWTGIRMPRSSVWLLLSDLAIQGSSSC